MASNTYLTDFLEFNAQHYPNKPAIVSGSKTLDWRELKNAADRVAACITPMLGNERQKVVALLFPNNWEYVAAYLGVLQAGHIAMPLDVIYKSLELEAILHQIPPDLVITDSVNIGRLPGDAHNLLFDDLTDSGSSSEVPALRLPPSEQIASLVFTSGTTGRPKAAPYTHANHIWNIEACSEVWQWDHNDSLLISLRLSHWFGLVMGLSGVLYHGNTMYLQERFEPEATLRALSSGQGTIFTHVAGTFTKLLEVKNFQDYDLSKVRLLISGGAPLPPASWQEIKKRFGHEVLEVYGSSESGRIASNLLDERIPGSPGRPLPGVDVKFSGNGEVLVKSPGVFPGYYKNSALTKASKTDDGYWRTGDLGEFQNGRIVLKGRKHERIRRQGYSISPRDIEWALHTLPEVTDVFVMGVQHTEGTDDELVYFLVTSLDEQAILDFCKQSMPSVWRPNRLVILDRLPRTPNGKPELPKLKAML